MQGKGYYDYTIDTRDVDFRDRATLGAMCHYILQAAGDDADINGFGVHVLNCGNCSWVLSRMAVEFVRWPVQGERITVHTWVNEVSRLTTTRNMTVCDERGEQIAAAVTLWAMIDLDRRTAVDIREHINYDGTIVDRPSPIPAPARIGTVAPEATREHRVVYSDIDFNRHVNSLKYMEWMFDMVPEEYFEEGRLRRIDVNFIHEARYGQLLTVGFRGGEPQLFEIGSAETPSMCRAAFRWHDSETAK